MENKPNSQIRYDFYCFYNDKKVLEYSCHSEEKRNIKELIEKEAPNLKNSFSFNIKSFSKPKSARLLVITQILFFFIN